VESTINKQEGDKSDHSEITGAVTVVLICLYLRISSLRAHIFASCQVVS